MSIRMLQGWIRERYGWEHLAFALFMGLAGTTAFDLPRLAWAVTVAWVGLGALRLGDDLIDRSKDRCRIPPPFVVREPQAVSGLVGFVMVGCLLAGLLIFLWESNARAAFGFGILVIGLAVWYVLRGAMARLEHVHSFVLLAKYPALVATLVVAANHSVEPTALVVVYLLMILHEQATANEDPPPWGVFVKKWRYLLFGLGILLINLISNGKDV